MFHDFGICILVSSGKIIQLYVTLYFRKNILLMCLSLYDVSKNIFKQLHILFFVFNFKICFNIHTMKINNELFAKIKLYNSLYIALIHVNDVTNFVHKLQNCSGQCERGIRHRWVKFPQHLRVHDDVVLSMATILVYKTSDVVLNAIPYIFRST